MQKQKERVQVVVDGFVSMIYFQNMKQAIIYVDSSCCGFCQKQDMPLNLYHINMTTRLCFSKPSKKKQFQLSSSNQVAHKKFCKILLLFVFYILISVAVVENWYIQKITYSYSNNWKMTLFSQTKMQTVNPYFHCTLSLIFYKNVLHHDKYVLNKSHVPLALIALALPYPTLHGLIII